MRSASGVVSIVAQSPVAAQNYQPSESNLKAREWFQDARFGMFIHWGVYSVPADGEWYMEQKHVPVVEYEKFAPQFNPTQFNAAEIVALNLSIAGLLNNTGIMHMRPTKNALGWTCRLLRPVQR